MAERKIMQEWSKRQWELVEMSCQRKIVSYQYRITIDHGRTTRRIELATEETVEVVAEPYDHDANLAEVLDDSFRSLSSDLQSKVREDMESRPIGKKPLPRDLIYWN